MPEDTNGNDVSLSINAIRDIGHDATKNGRISKDALIRVALQEEARIQEKFRLAEILAERSGRKTVKEVDIRTVDQLLNADMPP